jgi:hypothetical protein
MIPGYNHNVKYKDRVYHVQTEDSGVQTPHVITHLFVGGNIVESRKTSYADIVNSPRLGELLVEIMQAQHKGMLKDLIGGKLDHKIAERSKNAATLNGPAPLNVDAGAQHRASFGLPVDPAVAKQAATPPATTTPAKPVQPSAGAYATAAAAGTPVKSDPNPFSQAPRPPPGPVGGKPAQPIAAARPVAGQPAARPATPPPRPAGAAAQAQSSPPTFGGLPPKSSTTIPKTGAPAAITRPVPPPAPIASAPKAQEAVLEAETLARAFESKNESAVDSIFGEDLISEKSLDEVILSYLADDLQKE